METDSTQSGSGRVRLAALLLLALPAVVAAQDEPQRAVPWSATPRAGDTTARLTASASTVLAGRTVTLTVEGENGRGWITPGPLVPTDDDSGLSGTVEVRVDATTTFTYTVAGPDGPRHDQVEVRVVEPPTATLTSTHPLRVRRGERLRLSAVGAHAISGRLEPLGVTFNGPTHEHLTEPLERSAVYTLTVDGPGGQAVDRLEVEVVEAPRPTIETSPSPNGGIQVRVIDQAGAALFDTVVSSDRGRTFVFASFEDGVPFRPFSTVDLPSPPAPPTPQITPSRTVVDPGEEVVLTVAALGAESADLDGRPAPLYGLIPVSPSETTEYVYTAYGAGGETSVSTTVAVLPEDDWSLALGGGGVAVVTGPVSYLVPAASIAAVRSDVAYVTFLGGWWPMGWNGDNPTSPAVPTEQLSDRAQGLLSLGAALYPGGGRWGGSLSGVAVWETARGTDYYLARAFGLAAGPRARFLDGRLVVGADLQLSDVSEHGRVDSRLKLGLTPSITYSYLFR